MHNERISKELRIGQLAGEFGLNPKTIRYYEDLGLLSPPRRSPAGYRLFGEADRERLRFVTKARAIGLTLREISNILALREQGREPCEHVLALLDEKVAAVDRQFHALAAFRKELVTLREEAAESRTVEGCICGMIEHHQPKFSARPLLPLQR